MKKRIFIVLAVVASLVGCGKKNIEVKTPLEDEHAMVAGSWNGTDTDDTFYGKSYVSDGYYQIKNNLLQFTSYENGEDYVICTQTNCRHNNDSCAAWINGGRSALGLARYKNQLYVVDYTADKRLYTLRTMDLAGENQKNIVEIPCGDNKKDGWQLSVFEEVFYCNDIAWCSITYDYIENGEYKDAINQCVGYRLDTGEKIEVTKLSRNHSEISDPYLYKSITEKYIVIQDFRDYSLDVYDIDRKDMNIYKVKDMQEALSDTGLEFLKYELYDIRYLGNADKTGLFYFQVYVYADDSKEENIRNIIFAWNFQDAVQIMADYGTGGVLFEMQGGIQCNVWSEKEILYAVDKDNEKTQIVRLDLLTESSTPLFVDDNVNISFRVLYDCDDFYVGTLDDGDTLCKIDKNAYDRGDFSQAVKIKKLGVF